LFAERERERTIQNNPFSFADLSERANKQKPDKKIMTTKTERRKSIFKVSLLALLRSLWSSLSTPHRVFWKSPFNT
jgi:hypothetical protein